MKWRTLDEIVHSALIQRGYPVHFYLQFLKYASDCLRELHFDTLRSVNTKKLLINSYKAIELPCDYVDFVRIGIGTGQLTTQLAGASNFNRLNNYDAGGKKVIYGDWWGYRGNTGYWGYNPSSTTYSIVKERGEIQIHEAIISNYIILDYISDCSDPDNATKVDPYAQKAIEAYIFWQHKEHNRSYGLGERSEAKRYYEDQHRILRARKDDLTIESIKLIMQKGPTVFINSGKSDLQERPGYTSQESFNTIEW